MITSRPTPRALNKPLTIAGIERRLLGAAFIVSIVVSCSAKYDPTLELVIGALIFTVMIGTAKLLTRKDDRTMSWLWSVWKQKAVYDPAIREVR